MNQHELMKNANYVLDFLRESWKTGVLDFKTVDNKLLFRDVYAIVNPKTKLDLGCFTCLKTNLNVLLSWYENQLKTYKPEGEESKIEEVTEEQVMTGLVAAMEEEKKIEEVIEKLSRAEILAKARAARKQEQK
jgi:hypothetical protein